MKFDNSGELLKLKEFKSVEPQMIESVEVSNQNLWVFGIAGDYKCMYLDERPDLPQTHYFSFRIDLNTGEALSLIHI